MVKVKYIKIVTSAGMICLLILFLIACGDKKGSSEQTVEPSSAIVQDEKMEGEESISKAEQKELVNALLAEIESMNDGDSSSTAKIMMKIGYDPYVYHPMYLLEVHSQLVEAAKENGIILDMSKYEGLAVGMPQYLEFIIRK